MRILMINSVCGIRSTGRICTDLAQDYEARGHTVKIAYGRETVPEQYQHFAVKIGNDLDHNLHALQTRVFDNHGLASREATRQFLKWADRYNPHLLWLHNLHGYYINYEMLFEWIKKRPMMRVRWTLHDCWAFTGHCAYFTAVKCAQWKDHCAYCCQKTGYPSSYVMDNCKKNFDRKRAAFTGVAHMTLITPSKWLADLVKQSFLKGYPVKVIYNKIDTDVFKPTPSDFRARYGLEDKTIVLGVASAWGERKGLKDFYKLSKMLDDKYCIVLVGLTEKQIEELPEQIKGIARTNSTRELAEAYSAADVFVNPSREETFGMTTVEAVACGTAAIVYEDTACEEVIRNCVDSYKYTSTSVNDDIEEETHTCTDDIGTNAQHGCTDDKWAGELHTNTADSRNDTDNRQSDESQSGGRSFDGSQTNVNHCCKRTSASVRDDVDKSQPQANKTDNSRNDEDQIDEIQTDKSNGDGRPDNEKRTYHNQVVPQNVKALYKAITGKAYKGGCHEFAISKLICIHRTNSAQELAEIYSAADVFINPTYEDNYPTVNLEAQACGTPVITYNTGGCAETLLVGPSGIKP